MTARKNETYFERVDGIDWGAYGGPSDYRPAAVRKALRLIASPDEWPHKDPCEALRVAAGSDCGGTYYPCAVPVLELLFELLESTPDSRVRSVIIGFLDDWTFFGPETGSKKVTGAGGEPVDLATLFQRAAV